MRRLIAIAFLSITACGARTGLEVEPRSDAGQLRDASDEECNGADDDGDGSIDEDVPPIECTSGTCRRAIPGCVDGHVPQCPPIEPSDEVCNAEDDDCDGRIDEALGFGPIGDPIVVREASDGTTGDESCAECREVIRAQLVTISGELYAIWHLNFFGVIDVPNTFIRPLDQDGMPIGPSRPLFDVSTTRLNVVPSHSGRSIAAFCERLEDRQDYPRSIFLDGRARVIGEPLLRAPSDAICRSVALAVWTGDRHLFAQPSAAEEGFTFEVADRDAHTIRSTDVAGMSAGQTLAFDGTLATFATVQRESDPAPGTAPTRLRIVQLDTEGTVVLDRTMPWPSSRASWGPHVSVVDADAGPLIVTSSAPDFPMEPTPSVLGLFRFSRDDGALEPIGEVPVDVRGNELAVTRRSSDELIVALEGPNTTGGRSGVEGLEILQLRESGEELGRWAPPPRAGELSRFTIHTHRGRVFLTYRRRFDRGDQTVEVLRLGCTP